MKINLTNVFYIVAISSIIGLLINFFRPDGISLTRESKKLTWADSLSLNKRLSSDSLKINQGKSTSKNFAGNFQKEAEKNVASSKNSFKKPIAINLEQAYKLYKGNIIFLDARENEDYKEGHIKNALSLPYYDFDNYKQILRNIPESSVVVTYCAGTNCDLSILLGKQLFEIGYKRVYIFFGGWNDWLKAKYPIEKKVNSL